MSKLNTKNADLFIAGDPIDNSLWQQAALMVDAPPRPSKGYVTCPLGWLARVLPRARSAQQLAVLLLIYRRCLWARSRTISLPNSDLAAIDMSRYGKYRALDALARLDLIVREPWDGKTTRVTLSDFP
jgi:hypothetical protein